MPASLAFDTNGLLPIGDHALTLRELSESVLVTGRLDLREPWDAAWRLHLVNNLRILVEQLWQVGITNIFVDGSFVEEKAHPNDIDGYFECDVRYLASGLLAADLNQLDKFGVWTWSQRTYDPNSAKAQLPMWHQYHVELYPEFGQLTGILDEFGNNQLFPAAFRKTRGPFTPKGIVRIVR